MKNGLWGVLLSVLVSGCASPFGYYKPAVVENGIIQNPMVGWNGYSIRVPEGMTVFNPIGADPDSAKLTDLQRWYMEEDQRYSAVGYVNYSERFLIEEEGSDSFISFICDTYDLSGGWATVSSVEGSYLLGKISNRKMVEINDTSAKREEITVNGQRAWYICGTSRPYFQKNYTPLAYEGYFIFGKLKEAFWIEGFGELDDRDGLKIKVREMAESLVIQ